MLGTGTAAVSCPRPCAEACDGDRPAHSRDYLPHKERLQALDSITIVGSGQSAAEIYHDLLGRASTDHGYQLNWVTRSPAVLPDGVHQAHPGDDLAGVHGVLPGAARARPATGCCASSGPLQGHQRRPGRRRSSTCSTSCGSPATGRHHAAHQHRGRPARRRDGAAYDLELHHEETTSGFGLRTEGLVLATGYPPRVPDFLDAGPRPDQVGRARPLRRVPRRTPSTTPAARSSCRTPRSTRHGFVAPDLGMGAYRNSVHHRRDARPRGLPGREADRLPEFGVPDHLTAVGPMSSPSSRSTLRRATSAAAARLGDPPAVGLLGDAGRERRRTSRTEYAPDRRRPAPRRLAGPASTASRRSWPRPTTRAHSELAGLPELRARRPRHARAGARRTDDAAARLHPRGDRAP